MGGACLVVEGEVVGGRERRCMGGGTKGEKDGLSESPMVRDISARCMTVKRDTTRQNMGRG